MIKESVSAPASNRNDLLRLFLEKVQQTPEIMMKQQINNG
jgi:hypothetical protein